MIASRFIEINWGDKDETYLLWRFCGDWTGETYFNSMLQLWRLMDTKNHPLNLHIDMQDKQNPTICNSDTSCHPQR
ncbi:MAG: hypothetical protein Q9P01_13775 [Anaerolineae bacterium]|nr:hypothetical protein [Anaerolineae bacterium]